MNSSKILYIDDDQQNLDVFYYAFREQYDVYITSSIDEATEYLNNKEIKVLVSDQRMPDIMGIELIHQIRISHPSIIHILVTAYADMDLAIEAINRAGVYRFIQKPWSHNEMLIALQQAIEKYDLLAERDSLYKSLSIQNEKLKIEKIRAVEASRLKDAFLGNLSHEIRTPMNAIMGFSEFLLDERKGIEERRRFSALIHKSCNNLLYVLDDLILLSQLQAECYTPVSQELALEEIGSILEKITTNTSQRYPNNMNQFFLSNDKTQKKINCCWECIDVALSKIIDNAFKYTFNGQVNVSFTLVKQFDKSWLKFAISDTGIGIEKEYHIKIMEAFYKLETDKKILNSGNGIGLSIAKGLIDITKGKIEVSSEPGEGSTFSVWFPVDYQDQSDADKITSDDNL